jgi:hypothetical protein
MALKQWQSLSGWPDWDNLIIGPKERDFRKPCKLHAINAMATKLRNIRNVPAL